MAARIAFSALLALCLATASAQITTDTKDIQVAKQKLQIGTDPAKYLSSIVQVITGAATHNQSPTAKAVYDYIQGFAIQNIQGNPVDATTPANKHTVLRWSGAAWIANGINLYDIITTSGTISDGVNEVWVDDLTASITLNLPACNTANNHIRIEISKAGADAFGVVIEPAGSELFSDGATSKTIFSTGTGISCTCRKEPAHTGFWFFKNM